MLKKIVHEPLVHFLLLGALIFFTYNLISDNPTGASSNRIKVDAGTIQQLKD